MAAIALVYKYEFLEGLEKSKSKNCYVYIFSLYALTEEY